jgi:hypothetical protein
MARRLHSYLPPTIRLEGFQLKFATYLNGWSLNSLYSLVEGCAPCLLLIKSVEVEAVVGVYLSTCLAPPSSRTKGDGSSFCFRLDGPDGACYRWSLINHQYLGVGVGVGVGGGSTIQQQTITTPPTDSSKSEEGEVIIPSSPPSSSATPTSAASSSSSSTTPPPPSPQNRLSIKLLEPNTSLTSSTFHQFAHCTVDYMAFGGSQRHGTNALRLTSDLMLCSSGHSDTFNNPSLTPDEPNEPWYVAEIEVFCGSHSVNKQHHRK